MNECAQMLAVSSQLNSAFAFGSAADGECCTGPIVCDLNRRIIEINISGHKLRGALPDSLFALSSLVELNLSDNPGLIGRLPTLSSTLRYIDVSNTGLSGPVDIFYLNSSRLMTCKFGKSSNLCIQSQSVPGNLCSGGSDLEICSLKSSTTSTTSASISTTTIMETETILSSSISSPSDLHSEIRLDNSDISSPIIIIWTIAAILMAVSLIFCLCIMFAHKYGKTDKVASNKTHSMGRRDGKHCNQKGEISPRFESLVQNKLIYEARAEILADRIISNNGSRYFPVISEYSQVKPDEMSLSIGDTITLYRVFDDGWAEGVSLRNSSSAYFPLKCLGGCVPTLLKDSEFWNSNIVLESDLESMASPLPPLLHATPVFLSPTTASRHTILPLFDTKISNGQLSQKSEKLIDLGPTDGTEEPDDTPLLGDRNLDFDSSYNPFRGSLLNKTSGTNVSFPKQIHSFDSSSDFYKNSH